MISKSYINNLRYQRSEVFTMTRMAFRILCALACSLYFFLDRGTYLKLPCICVCVCVCARCMLLLRRDSFKTAASQGPCENPNLILISSSTPISVVSLQQPLCFGCIFMDTFLIIPIPLGTEWVVIDDGATTSLTNETTVGGVMLSGTNGTVLVQSPSSLLMFQTSQIRCTFTNAANVVFTRTTFFTQLGKSCLSQVNASHSEKYMYIHMKL